MTKAKNPSYDRAAAMRAQNANPEFQRKRLEALAAVNSDPEWQEARVSKVKAYFAKPEVKMMRGEKQKNRWLNDAYYLKMCAAIKKGVNKKAAKARHKEGLAHGAKERANRPAAKERARRMMVALNKKRNPLFGMTEKQKKEYRRLVRCGATREEAIRKATRH